MHRSDAEAGESPLFEKNKLKYILPVSSIINFPSYTDYNYNIIRKKKQSYFLGISTSFSSV